MKWLFCFTRKGKFKLIRLQLIEIKRFVKRFLDPQSLLDIHDNFASLFPVSRRTVRRLHRTDQKNHTQAKCLIPHGHNIHKSEAILVSKSVPSKATRSAVLFAKKTLCETLWSIMRQQDSGSSSRACLVEKNTYIEIFLTRKDSISLTN